MKISAYFDPGIINTIKNCYLIIDTNILTSCASNKDYLDTFLNIFKENSFLIDPIVRLEFLRSSNKVIFEAKSTLLEFNKFITMVDHHDIYKKVYTNAFDIAKIYTYYGNPNIPLGDILIVSRLMLYDANYLFITLDKSDFSTILFDRIGVVSIERKSGNKDKPRYIIDHISLLQFNQNKYKKCLDELK